MVKAGQGGGARRNGSLEAVGVSRGLTGSGLIDPSTLTMMRTRRATLSELLLCKSKSPGDGWMRREPRCDSDLHLNEDFFVGVLLMFL